jgi:fermentation-respiration switch protein FrsA (DUF1100 family)
MIDIGRVAEPQSDGPRSAEMWRRWTACGGVLAALFGTASCTVSVGQSALFPPRYEPLPSLPEGIVLRNIELGASDGVALRGWYLEKEHASRTALFFYGNRSSVVLSTWALYWLADALDANVVAFDYRGYGFSDGRPEIDRIVEDALEIYSYTVDKLGRGSTPIMVVGQSMGTASALHVAANRKVDAILLMAPLGSVNDLLEAMRRRTPFYVSVKGDASLENLRVSPLHDAERVRARTLMVSGSGDILASPGAIARLQTACGSSEKSVCRVPGGHGDVQAENPAVRKCIAGFVHGHGVPHG